MPESSPWARCPSNGEGAPTALFALDGVAPSSFCVLAAAHSPLGPKRWGLNEQGARMSLFFSLSAFSSRRSSMQSHVAAYFVSVFRMCAGALPRSSRAVLSAPALTSARQLLSTQTSTRQTHP